MLDRLELRKLVSRRSNASDRRSWMIDVTPDGKALAERLRKEYTTFEEQLLKRIKARDLQGFEAVTAVIGDVTNVALGSTRTKVGSD
jgi:DNA-binding MarR family transcriptional regulator